MQQFMISSFNYAHQSFNLWRSFVYSSMTPSMSLRMRIAVAFHGLLKRSRRGGESRLLARHRELQRNVPVVASVHRDRFQRQGVERF